MPTLAPPQAVIDAILSAGTDVVRRAEIYEEDGTTLWHSSPLLVDGSVNISLGRTERRTFDATFSNRDNTLDHYPGGFWYDKIIKTYRGVRYGADKTLWETQIGEFMIDGIDSQNFPKTIKVTGRDYSKKLMLSKFTQATTFASGSSPESLIKTIALNGGITKFNLLTTGKTTGKEFTFERGVERWTAINDIATAYNLDVYFDAFGYLTLKENSDPTTSPEVFTFQTGPDVGNLATIEKSSTDARIYNHIVVTGEATNQIPVFAEALNTAPTSPTRISELGDRVYQYTSSFITTTLQAQGVADSFLKVHALESFEIRLGALVIPWLEAGDIGRFVDPDAMPGDPTRYLLSDITLPLKLGAMDVTGKRVTIVG